MILGPERERAQRHMQLLVDNDRAERELIQRGLVPAFDPGEGRGDPVHALPPTALNDPRSLPKHLRKTRLDGIFEDLENDAHMAKKRGVLKIEEFETIKNRLAQEHLEKENRLNSVEEAGQQKVIHTMALSIQRITRGWLGRRKAKAAENTKDTYAKQFGAMVVMQKHVRGVIGRKRANAKHQKKILEVVYGSSVALIQRVRRGYIGRLRAKLTKEARAALVIQCIIRGYRGRMIARRERGRLEYIRMIHLSAVKVSFSELCRFN